MITFLFVENYLYFSSKFPEPDDSNSRKENRAYNLQRNTKKKKRKQSWQTKLSKQREQRRLIRELEQNGLIPKVSSFRYFLKYLVKFFC